MCEKKPGPRCNDKCKVRDAKLAAYKKVAQRASKDSFDYNQALSELVVSQEVYDTTPKGIQELKTSLSELKDSVHAVRYAKGKATRIMQGQALSEIECGRTEKIATLISDFDSFFSTEEIESVIQSSRENREKFVIQKLSESIAKSEDFSVDKIESEIFEVTEKSGSQYKEYLNKIKHDIIKKNGTLTEEQELVLEELANMSEPSNVNLYAYKSMGFALQKSRAQMSSEIYKISAMQDSSPQVIAEYFDAYSNQYRSEYAQADSDKQPNPPKNWIESESINSGFVNSSNTNFIPRDPATIYAFYKLRTDLEAVPDHLKLSTKITAIDNLKEGYDVTQVSRSGKIIRKEHCTTEEDLTKVLIKDVKDSVIMMVRVPDEIYEKSKNRHRFISLADINSKHFETYSGKGSQMAEFLKVDNNTLSIYSGLRKRMLKTWATKKARMDSKRLSFNPEGTSRSLALVR